ncbi:LytTR family DNA-binding domain-containing protein [Lactobacillus sp. ESL0731]|uniref:LytTR family DNA-binding domain-containing protein n=1 Tax=unclassified Lactobacillus TaxID=2620435 RepID=UPI0023F6A154|nr:MULTISPECIES: LytTR family DNA-binding domain-containing protein [unclassified Lactobacillus]WEV51067.1 LytTR family DNA-binding domain-containing protein [Lactobacillus sp. ESL0700]WEV62197.1 LytTR family DNA-binding domain-containing protein [Lactobacillus sp. ESL0731]
MKVKIDLDPDVTEPVVTIQAKELSPEIERIYRQLQEVSQRPDQLECYKDDVSYYLDLNDILFFETEDRQVVAHTGRDSFSVNYKLYELENLLSSQFMRVSKSTILNLKQVYSLTRSITNCQVHFHDTYKTVYVSRHYYHSLSDRLNERRPL